MLEPKLTQNRERFLRNKKALSHNQSALYPTNGWDCWGLGYLDEKKKKVGCLLHPSQNQGTDFRYLVGYERKCAREVCLEGMTFNALNIRAKKFYLSITRGMDSFHYSSRKWNPIFPILLWGRKIGEKIAEAEECRIMCRNEFMSTYGNFINRFSYKTDGYVLERVIEKVGIWPCTEADFVRVYGEWKERVVQKIQLEHSGKDVSKDHSILRPVHLFEIPLSFSRFLKFSLNIWKASEEKTFLLKEEADKEIDRFMLLQ